MHIKSIVLDGFKSYGQRTEISGFDPMFNAITGLNGSGKSNILDAICFLLGISNLTHVRANSLQDLIYKSGQAGINKATVSISFDNRNHQQSPPGFEQVDEITITRQISLGGKNKYVINGVNVNSKKVQDLFCSIQLNVNNPHFLIMQGRITKVLNMKPLETLAMVEEAAGTRMYEVKRQNTKRLMEKKDSKLSEFQAILTEELSPKLQKLKAEREQYLEYQRIEREVQHHMSIFEVWQYFEAKRNVVRAQQALESGQHKIKQKQETIEQNKEVAKQLEAEVENITSNIQSESSNELQAVVAQLKEKEKEEAKINASVKSMKDDIATEDKKRKQLERTVDSDQKALTTKEQELSQVESLFITLKENDKKDTEALALAEKKYEALCAGMEINDEGAAETLAEQLMNAKGEATRASTEGKQSAMLLGSCQSQLKQIEKNSVTNSSDYETDNANLQKAERDVAQLETSIKRVKFSQEQMSELQNRRRTLHQEVTNLRDQMERIESRKPYTVFRYSDPEPNFNRSSVKGVVCNLFKCNNLAYAMALEAAAGGKLFNVIVDNEGTSKKLLQKGDLQRRTTFIPLNRMTVRKMSQQKESFAQNLVGKENCQPALSLIEYHKSMQAAMEFIFGNVFICKDINTARQVTFHDQIKVKCVTLDGDSTDPSGIISGGAVLQQESVLKLVQDMQNIEGQLNVKEQELAQIDDKLRQMSEAQEQYESIKYKLNIAKHQVNLITQRLQNTTFARQRDEVNSLKAQITELTEKIKSCEETERKLNAKVKELQNKMKDASGYRERRLKEAETEMKKAKTKADKSQKEWRQREQDYETLTLEIQELKKSLENRKQELDQTKEHIKQLQEEVDKASEGSLGIKEAVKELQLEVKKFKALIAEKNSKIQSKIKKKQQLLEQNTELELEIKKFTHEIKALTSACNNSKHREQEYFKKIGKKNNTNFERGETMSPEEGKDLERKIKVAQEKMHELGRTTNTQAQSMFEVEEKRFDEIIRKQKIVLVDKQKLIRTIEELDEKKKEALKLAFEQVSKDFGSIFATLLPGANARLAPIQGKTILQGLEIKVSLGNVWKQSLTELSGGQRSLAALSLILAMLLFKPAPLYILDEVDAALDLSHTQNIGNMLRSHFKKSQNVIPCRNLMETGSVKDAPRSGRPKVSEETQVKVLAEIVHDPMQSAKFIVVSLKDGMFNNANVLFRTKFIDGVSAVQRTENTRRN